MGSLARKFGCALGAILVLAIAGVLLYRAVTGVRIVDLSQVEADRIWGPDLRRVDVPSKLPEVSIEEVLRIARDPIAQRASSATANKSFSPADIRDILASAPLLEKLNRLIAGKVIRLDRVSRSGDREMSSFADMKALGKVYLANIKLANEQHNADRCFRSAMMALEFDDLLLRSPIGEQIDYLVRLSTQAIIFAAIERPVQDGIFTEEQLASLYQRIRPATKSDDRLREAMKLEWETRMVPQLMKLRSAEDINELHRGLYGGMVETHVDFAAGELDKAATLKTAASLCRILIANCGRSWADQDPGWSKELDRLRNLLPPEPEPRPGESWYSQSWERAKFRAKMRSLPNSLGKWFLGLHLALNISESSFNRRTMREGLRLLILIERYRKLHQGTLPGSLAELKPMAGESFPIDYFASAPFRYSKSRRLFWSVGKNGLDDGGAGVPGRNNALDRVWSIP